MQPIKKGVAIKTVISKKQVKDFLFSLHINDGWYATGYAVRQIAENPDQFEFIQNGSTPNKYYVFVEEGTIYVNKLKGLIASCLADKDISFTFDPNPKLPHAIRNLLEKIAKEKGSTVEV